MLRVFALLWTLLPVCLFAGCTGETPKPQVGHPAPDFSLTALDGREIRLRDLRGKVVFVNLWATWCPPCREEMPSMVRLYGRFRNQGLEILAVSEDADVEEVRRFARAYNVQFPILMDREKTVYQLYRATGVPETHLVNKEGVLEASRIGPFDWTAPAVVDAVRQLLAKP